MLPSHVGLDNLGFWKKLDSSFKWMRVTCPLGADHLRVVTNGGSNPAAPTSLSS